VPRGESFGGIGRLAAAFPVCGEAAPIANRWRPRPGVPTGGCLAGCSGDGWPRRRVVFSASVRSSTSCVLRCRSAGFRAMRLVTRSRPGHGLKAMCFGWRTRVIAT